MAETTSEPKITIPKVVIPLPDIQFLVQRKNELELNSFCDKDYKITKESFPVNGEYQDVSWSPNGQYCILTTPTKVDIVNVEENKLQYTLNIERVYLTHISPLSTFLLLWSKFNGKDNNLFVYTLATGELHTSYIQKTMTKQKWPCIQWTDDEELAARQTTERCIVHNGHDLTLPSTAFIKIPAGSFVGMSPVSKDNCILVYTPSAKGSSSSLLQYKRSNNYIRSFNVYNEHRSTYIEYHFNKEGTLCICLLKNDLDKTGSSYYGTCTPLYINLYVRTTVNLSRPEATLSACSWNPKGDKFICIYNTRPATAYVYNEDNTLHFAIPAGIYNDLVWSPHSRYVALTGFGNLSGDIQIYDIYKKKLLGRCQYKSTSTLYWSASSKYIYLCTSFLRMKVDNNWTILKYNCKQIYNQKEDCLLSVTSRPRVPDFYPIRAVSPRGKQETKDGELNKEKKKEKWVPPSLRNQMNKGIPGLSPSLQQKQIK
ncbi:hypothetical protein WA158_008408 [Blastocystis sp. Blastoise]